MGRIQRLLTVVTMALIAVVSVNSLAAQPAEQRTALDRSPLLKEPATPEEMFGATLLMVDLARMDLAKLYLEQFDETSPDDEMLLKLRDKYGSADFLKLARNTELQPRSTKLLERLFAAAKRQAEDPVFIAGLVQKLTQVPGKRELVIGELRNIGVTVVPEIVKQLASDEMVEHEATLATVLLKMGNQVVPPLIGALDTPQERPRLVIISLLERLNATEAIPYLWYPAFDENQSVGVRDAAKSCLAKLIKGDVEKTNRLSSVEASNELRRLAKQFYRKPYTSSQAEDGRVSLWAWSDELGTVVKNAYTPEIASLMLSARFSRQALALSPEQLEPQRQYLASLLGLEVARNGWERARVPTPDTAMYLGLTAGETTMSHVLSEALEAGQPGTAVSSLEILSQIGNRDLLLSKNGLKAPVVAALNSSDPRVQFAAATTVMKLDPKAPFRGANRVVGILARSTIDPERSRAIIIDADGERANQTSGFIVDGGIEGIIAATGREGFELAATSSGIEFVVVHVNCLRWELTQTLANFRADARTAAIPIVIYGPASLRGELARLVTRTSPAIYVEQSASPTDFLAQLMPFLKTVKTPPLSPQERALQRNAAVYWLATIGSGGYSKFFDISQAEKELSISVDDPAVAKNALIALGSISTGSAQRRLSEIALNALADPAIRSTAADQLAFHIQRFGLLLDRDAVIHVHSAWKQAAEPGVKSSLAVVIGSLQPNATIVGERLQQFPIPPAN